MNTPTNYHDFRKVFLELCASKGLEVIPIQHRGLSPSGRPLFTDIARTIYNSEMPTLIHISGCHGVEGYLGSLIQREILMNLDVNSVNRANIIFVHSVNPWGMSWYRRVNAHNVDLNRNFFPVDQERPQNPDFDIFAPLFDRRFQGSKWQLWKAILKYVIKNGLQQTLKTMANGQYHNAESLFYGGTDIEPEIVELIKSLRSFLSGTKPIYVIDVHSGLGDFASENILLDGAHTEQEAEFWKSGFGESVIDPASTKGFYAATGTLSQAFRNTFANRQVHYIFEEFGTKSKYRVFRNLIDDHKRFLKLKMDRNRSFKMIETYFPYEKSWRQIASTIGKDSYFRILNLIQSPNSSDSTK
jgi:hypothetical protein